MASPEAMSDHPCGQMGSLPCATCPGAPALLTLAEAVARFEREARRGVCDTGRYHMPFYCWGEGPPLVFIHGVCDTSRSFLLPIARLSTHFRCIAYDLPSGHGDGARLAHYAAEDLVQDLFTLLDHLGLVRAYLLASSFGSTIALRALRAAPQRLPRAVLQGGLAYRPLRFAERCLAWLARRAPGRMAKVPRRERLLELVHRPLFSGREEVVWRAFVDWTGEARIRALGHQALWLHRTDLRPILPEVRQPVLLVVGERDTVVPGIHADVLMHGLPNAGKAILAGSGHVPSYTHPEALAEVVRQFLTPPGTCPPACAAQAACKEPPTPGGS
jgi:pimeloyl-ACP methyl ester carboxylesterase